MACCITNTELIRKGNQWFMHADTLAPPKDIVKPNDFTVAYCQLQFPTLAEYDLQYAPRQVHV
jgi:hypothetical protein